LAISLQSAGICGGPAIQRIHPTIKVATDVPSSLCSQKGWEVTNSVELLTCKLVDSKKWLPVTIYHQYSGWDGK